jgi:two-component system LytT family response regulator
VTLNALVVDDEPIARAGLTSMVRSDPDFSVVRACGDCDAAVRLIRNERLHVVLLDIQLNPGTGFDIIDRVGADAMPPVVFVTAFDEFALKAFDSAAVDYVVKPVDPERLRVALNRVKTRNASASVDDAISRLSAAAAALRQEQAKPVVVSDGDRTLVFEHDEIIWIGAADYYASVNARGRSWLIRESLDAFERRLPRPPFFRVHRSAIVNIRFVAEVARLSRHRSAIVLRDGSRIAVSAERRAALEAWLSTKDASV